MFRLHEALVEKDSGLEDDTISGAVGGLDSGTRGAEDDTVDARMGNRVDAVPCDKLDLFDVLDLLDVAVDGLDHFSSFGGGGGGVLTFGLRFRAGGGG